jgi:hypothetical protein
LDYKKVQAADTTTPDQLGEPPSVTDDIEAFAQAISLQAAARAARYAIGSRSGAPHAIGIQQENREIELGERVSLSRSFNLVLAFAIGVAVYAGIVYFILGMQLHSPLPSPSVAAATPLPPPSATAR